MAWTERIAAFLVVLSCVFYAGLLAVPFLAESTGGRATLSGGLIVAGEGSFWLGALVAGPAVMRRYRHHLDPRTWFERAPAPEAGAAALADRADP